MTTEKDRDSHKYLFEQYVRFFERVNQDSASFDNKLSILISLDAVIIGLAMVYLPGFARLLSLPLLLSIFAYIVGIWPRDHPAQPTADSIKKEVEYRSDIHRSETFPKDDYSDYLSRVLHITKGKKQLFENIDCWQKTWEIKTQSLKIGIIFFIVGLLTLVIASVILI